MGVFGWGVLPCIGCFDHFLWLKQPAWFFVARHVVDIKANLTLV